MKICKECAHSTLILSPVNIPGLKVYVDVNQFFCEKFKKIDMVTGQSEGLRPCAQCRNDLKLCGVDAKHWEPKEVTP